MFSSSKKTYTHYTHISETEMKNLGLNMHLERHSTPGILFVLFLNRAISLLNIYRASQIFMILFK